jgi:hypothetical protein
LIISIEYLKTSDDDISIQPFEWMRIFPTEKDVLDPIEGDTSLNESEHKGGC